MFLEQCTHDLKFENLSREELLGRLEVGDIFHAVGENGAVAWRMTATSGDPQARDLHRCLAREHALGRRGREPGADLPPGSDSGAA